VGCSDAMLVGRSVSGVAGFITSRGVEGEVGFCLEESWDSLGMARGGTG